MEATLFTILCKLFPFPETAGVYSSRRLTESKPGGTTALKPPAPPPPPESLPHAGG